MTSRMYPGAAVGIAVALLVLPLLAQEARQAQETSGAERPPAPFVKTPAPAPRRDVTGVWLGAAVAPKEPAPPMTAWGQQFFDAARPLFGPRAVPIAQTNDPLVTCDPMGFPRSLLYETRGFALEQVPRRMLQLLQYQRIWREIWTDGRPLPTTVNAPGNDTLDPRYYGYSVGRWDGDYTFVVTTTGFAENTWADELGHPRSTHAKVEERYRRIDAETLELNVTIDDPKSYTKPWIATNKRQIFRRSPKQEFEEQLCVPSEALEYRETFLPPGK